MKDIDSNTFVRPFSSFTANDTLKELTPEAIKVCWLSKTATAGSSTNNRPHCLDSRPIQEESWCDVQSFCFCRTQVRIPNIRILQISNKPILFIIFPLSKRKLVPWLKLILRNQTVVETLYQPWSYTVTTGEKQAWQLSTAANHKNQS